MNADGLSRCTIDLTPLGGAVKLTVTHDLDLRRERSSPRPILGTETVNATTDASEQGEKQ